MTHNWDEFSKSLAEELVPRRESLRRLGFVLAGAILSPLGLGTALARGTDPCKAFCRCRNKSQQKACLAACNACDGETWRLCGSCGSYVCCRETGPGEFGACIDGSCRYWCAEGAVYCDGRCTDLDNDSYNCGACGNVCDESTPQCIEGSCSECSLGLTNCGGVCVSLDYDRYNCGACGYQCGADGPDCVEGVCTYEEAPPDDGFGNPQVGESYDE
jgi:hypothetical protein